MKTLKMKPGSTILEREIKERGEEVASEIGREAGDLGEGPAEVSLEKSLPIDLARYLNAKVSVRISVPCPLADIEATTERLAAIIDSVLIREAATLPDLYRQGKQATEE